MQLKCTLQQTHLSDARFAEDSIYSRSFYQHDVCRAKPVLHADHIVMAGEFQDETVHKVCLLVFGKIDNKSRFMKPYLYIIIIQLPFRLFVTIHDRHLCNVLYFIHVHF